jgi:hypothetical protein
MTTRHADASVVEAGTTAGLRSGWQGHAARVTALITEKSLGKSVNPQRITPPADDEEPCGADLDCFVFLFGGVVLLRLRHIA